jgi:hypothetical protein
MQRSEVISRWLYQLDVIILSLECFLYKKKLILVQWSSDKRCIYSSQTQRYHTLWENNFRYGSKRTNAQSFYLHSFLGEPRTTSFNLFCTQLNTQTAARHTHTHMIFNSTQTQTQKGASTRQEQKHTYTMITT